MQLQAVEVVLAILKPSEVHHGDCIGSDSQFHAVAKFRKVRTIIHPPDNDRLRAHCQGGIEVYPRPYLMRNIDIISAADLVIATPDGKERDRSGTWMTIRKAKAMGKQILILYPDCNMEVR
jgi:hypothetical protein